MQNMVFLTCILHSSKVIEEKTFGSRLDPPPPLDTGRVKIFGFSPLGLCLMEFEHHETSRQEYGTNKSPNVVEYTCLGILLATFNYRARGTCDPSTLNYSLNGAANA